MLNERAPAFQFGPLITCPTRWAKDQVPMSSPSLAPGNIPKNAFHPATSVSKPSWSSIRLRQPFRAMNPKPNATRERIPYTPGPIKHCSNLLGNLKRNSIDPERVGSSVDMSMNQGQPYRRRFGKFRYASSRRVSFNILNRTNFSPPSDNLLVLDPGPGRWWFRQLVTNPGTDAEIQFGLKLIW